MTDHLPAIRSDLQPVPADRNPAVVYLHGLAPGSRRTLAGALDTMAEMLTAGKVTNAEDLPWAGLRYQHTAALRSALIERYSPASVNKHLAALRGVLREAWRLGLMSAEDLARAIDLKGVSNTTLPRGRAISTGELRALFDTCAAGTPIDVRDAAAMAVLFGAGLRRAELVNLDLGDYRPAEAELTVRGGKGRKDRLVYAENGAGDALADWLAVRGAQAGPLFCPVAKGGRVQVRPMSDQAVLHLVQRRAGLAGVSHLSPHDFRRTFVSELWDAGVDGPTIQKLTGHANLNTTAAYDRRGEHAKRKAAAMLHVPYRRRGIVEGVPPALPLEEVYS